MKKEDNKVPEKVIPQPLDDCQQLCDRNTLPPEHRRAIKELGPDLVERLFAEIEQEESSRDESTQGTADTP